LLNAAKALGFLIKHGIGAPGPMAEAQAKIYLKLRQAHPDASEKDILGTMFERAKIENFRFHDLRHTFASSYMMNGGDLYELAKILGHSKHRDDRTLCQAGAEAHCEDRQHGSGNLETDGAREMRQDERRLTMFA
jgi:hypothetical protein